MKKYFLKENGIQIMRSRFVKIKERIFDEELFDYRIVDREDLIENLMRWISEGSKDKELMKQDIKMLMSWEDDYIFSSISTNEYIGIKSSDFEEKCKELILINKEVAVEDITHWKDEVEALVEQIEEKISILPWRGDRCEDSQKVCLQRILNKFINHLNGVEEEDFYELNDEEE